MKRVDEFACLDYHADYSPFTGLINSRLLMAICDRLVRRSVPIMKSMPPASAARREVLAGTFLAWPVDVARVNDACFGNIDRPF